MSCDQYNNCRPDPVRQEARDIANMMDSGRQTQQVADALREDSYRMPPGEFNRMVGMIRQDYDRKNVGDDLYQRNDGALILDTGRGQMVVPTRQLVESQERMRHQIEEREHHMYGRPQVYDNQQPVPYPGERRPNTATEDLGRNVVIGAGVGGVIGGRRGAVGGAAAGVADTVIDHTGGLNTGNQVVDGLAKGAIGYGIGKAVGGNEGGKAGAVTGILDSLLNNKNR